MYQIVVLQVMQEKDLSTKTLGSSGLVPTRSLSFLGVLLVLIMRHEKRVPFLSLFRILLHG